MLEREPFNINWEKEIGQILDNTQINKEPQPQFAWKRVNPDKKQELIEALKKEAAETETDVLDDVPEDILASSETTQEVKLRLAIIELAMLRIHNQPGSLRLVAITPYGTSWSRSPITAAYFDNSLVVYRHTMVPYNEYQLFLQDVLEETNYILRDIGKESLPEYPA